MEVKMGNHRMRVKGIVGCSNLAIGLGCRVCQPN